MANLPRTQLAGIHAADCALSHEPLHVDDDWVVCYDPEALPDGVAALAVVERLEDELPHFIALDVWECDSIEQATREILNSPYVHTGDFSRAIILNLNGA